MAGGAVRRSTFQFHELGRYSMKVFGEPGQSDGTPAHVFKKKDNNDELLFKHSLQDV